MIDNIEEKLFENISATQIPHAPPQAHNFTKLPIKEMTREIIDRLGHRFTSIPNGPVFQYSGKMYQVKSRRLDTKFYAAKSNIDETVDELVVEINDIIDESDQFHPYVLLNNLGVLADASSGDIVCTFMIRYSTGDDPE